MQENREQGTETFVIEGRNAVLEAFRSGRTIDKIYVLDGCQDGPVRTIVREAKKHGSLINFVTKERLSQLSETGKHQGVIAHAAACHPYVEAAVRRTGISHSEIEAEMDRRNMEKDSYNPLTHRPANHLRSKPGYAETIAVFYPKQSVRQIDACIHSIRICCNLFVIPNLQMRSLILKLLKLVHFPKVIREMIIKCRKNPDCEPICRELDQLYSQAVPAAVELIQNFDEVLKGTGVFDSRFQHTFGEF